MQAEDAARVKALEKETAAATKTLEKLHADTAGLQGRVQELQEAIENTGGPPLKKLRQQVAQTQEVRTPVM